jgi:regulator of protease activity HflC (stomatin/prohibitin superfamily)
MCFSYPYITIRESKEGLLEVFGKYKKTLPPGMHFINK